MGALLLCSWFLWEDLGSFSTADIDESSEHQGVVCSRTVDAASVGICLNLQV